MTGKPPVGLRPKRVAAEERMAEVAGAIERYLDEGYPVPREWLEECDEIRKYLMGTAPKPRLLSREELEKKIGRVIHASRS